MHGPELQTHDSAADEECGFVGSHAEMLHSYQVPYAIGNDEIRISRLLIVLTALKLPHKLKDDT